MECLQLKRELKKELTRKQEVFHNLKVREECLAKFDSALDTAKNADHVLILQLIGLYRKLRQALSVLRSASQSQDTLPMTHDTQRICQQIILGILLLVFWGDMQLLRNDRQIRAKLFRIGDPFSEIYFAYILLIAEGDLSGQGNIRSIFSNKAREFIKEEYKKQCVYEI